jgi:hypothetical protein
MCNVLDTRVLRINSLDHSVWFERQILIFISYLRSSPQNLLATPRHIPGDRGSGRDLRFSGLESQRNDISDTKSVPSYRKKELRGGITYSLDPSKRHILNVCTNCVRSVHWGVGYLRLSQRCCRGLKSSDTWHCIVPTFQTNQRRYVPTWARSATPVNTVALLTYPIREQKQPVWTRHNKLHATPNLLKKVHSSPLITTSVYTTPRLQPHGTN